MMEERKPVHSHPFVAREAHYQRVNELLASNNQYLERARKAEAAEKTLRDRIGYLRKALHAALHREGLLIDALRPRWWQFWRREIES